VIADNAIPIKSWFSDLSDTALLNLLPMLDALRYVCKTLTGLFCYESTFIIGVGTAQWQSI